MTFLPIKNYEGLYEVSDTGLIKSVKRIVIGKDGIKYPFKERILKVNPNKSVEYPQVSLWKNNIGTTFYVHRLVAETFIPNPKHLPEVNHKDGNRSNNTVENLEWVDSKGNSIHAVQTGLRTYTNRLTKEEFIDCLYDVINGESYASLSNRVPYKVPFLSVKLRRIAEELGLENELNESLYIQRVLRARINGAKNNRTNHRN